MGIKMIQWNRNALGVFFISGCLLALEMLYIRFISILLYPVAAYLVISIALLGLGVSGGFLSLRRSAHMDFDQAGLSSLGFSLTVLLSLPLIWFAGTDVKISILLPFILAFPMFFGGLAISLSFTLRGSRLPVLYFADLLGAGTAAVLVMVALFYFDGIQVALLIIIGGLVAAGMFSPKLKWIALGGMVIFGAGFGFMNSWLPKGITAISPKELKLMLELGDVVWEYQGWSPLARVDVFSLTDDLLAPELAIPYKLVTHDGGAPSLLLDLAVEERQGDLIDHTIFGVPYWIKDEPSVLVIGLGGGPDIVAAIAAGASRILGAEVNPEMIAIVAEHYAEFTRFPYANEKVQIDMIDGRHLLANSNELFDIIQLTGVDTTVASLGANPNMAENYLYTQEAFSQYLNHLTSDGLLSISFPNVDGLGLRLFVLAIEALRQHDLVPIEEHVIVSEMTGYVHVLIKKSPFMVTEIATIQEHYQNQLTSIYFPLYHRLFGIPDAEFIALSRVLFAPGQIGKNQYAAYFAALEAKTEEEFIRNHPQNIAPPSDNLPFFFVLDRWGQRSANFDTILLTLGILFFFSVLLTLLPAFILGRKGLSIPRPGFIALYFAALGLGFIFMEVTMIQKLSLLVGHPSYSLVVTISSLLIASGLGSLLSTRFSIPVVRKAQLATLTVAVLVLIVGFGLEFLRDFILVQSMAGRVISSAIIVAIPGLLMGIPFPSGLSVVKGIEPSFVPWAWGINASFTVIGTILALLLALNIGYAFVLFIAALAYLIAALAISIFNSGKVVR